MLVRIPKEEHHGYSDANDILHVVHNHERSPVGPLLLVLWTTMCILSPDLICRAQNKWFPIPRETFNVVIYSFLGLFKIVFLVFNVVPYVALLIVG